MGAANCTQATVPDSLAGGPVATLAGQLGNEAHGQVQRREVSRARAARRGIGDDGRSWRASQGTGKGAFDAALEREPSTSGAASSRSSETAHAAKAAMADTAAWYRYGKSNHGDVVAT